MDIKANNNLDQLNLMNNMKVEKQSNEVKIDINKTQDVNKDVKQTNKLQEAYKVDDFKTPSKDTLDKMTLLNSLSELSKSQDVSTNKTSEQNSQNVIQNIELNNINTANKVEQNSQSSTNNNNSSQNDSSNSQNQLEQSIKEMQSTFSKNEFAGGFDKSKLQSSNNSFSNTQANLNPNRVQQLLS